MAAAVLRAERPPVFRGAGQEGARRRFGRVGSFRQAPLLQGMNRGGSWHARPDWKWPQPGGYSALLAAALPARRPKLIAMEWLAPATTTG